MKKILALVLSLALLLGMASLAETYVIDEGTTYCVTVEAPEGYSFTEVDYGDFIGGLFKSDDEDAPIYFTLLVAYSDEYADYFGKEAILNDLTEEQLEIAISELTSDFEAPEVTTGLTDFGTLCIIVNEQGCESEFASILTVYHGYFIQIYIDSPSGLEIGQELIDTGLGIMSSLELIEK